MSDKGTCPWCDDEFDVIAYGHKLPCPHCGQLIDVLPEPNVWFDTKWGTVGMTIPMSSLGKILRKK